MAGFGFSEAQQLLRREVRTFAQRELVPGAKERAKQEGLDRKLVTKLGAAGYLGVSVPEQHGGQGGDWVSAGIVIEELARADLVHGLTSLMPSLASLAMAGAPDEVRQEWLLPLVSGEKIGCLALTEPECGSDAAAITTRAVREGDCYILDGEKTSITGGMQADMAVVFAKTDMSKGARGVSCFVVPLGLPGVTRSRIADTGLKPFGRASLHFEGVRVPLSYRLGEEGQGFLMAMGQFNFARVSLGVASLAQAQTSLEEAVDYAKQRRAFGQPIARFEGVSFKLAQAATLLEAGKLLCYRALWLMDEGLPNTKESSMVKWWCPRIAVDIIHDCLLVFGHVGYSEEHPVEQRLRDVMGFEIGDGTADIMKIIIARELLGKEYLPY